MLSTESETADEERPTLLLVVTMHWVIAVFAGVIVVNYY
jgi:hypothetical protein